jgi:hypothetical protein
MTALFMRCARNRGKIGSQKGEKLVFGSIVELAKRKGLSAT